MVPVNSGPIGDTPALLVIDPQQEEMGETDEEFATSFGGSKGDVYENINALVAKARAADIPIIWGKELHRPSFADYGAEALSVEPFHTVEGTPSETFSDRVDVEESDMEPAEHVVTKRRYNLFHRTDLQHLLRTYDIETVILTGFMTHICVHYTAHGAHERDYIFRVVEECVGDPVSQYIHDAALDFMSYLQSDSRQSLETVTSALAEYDGNPVVRQVKDSGHVLDEDQYARAKEAGDTFPS